MAVAVPDTPEHDKLAAVSDKHDAIVDFVQWLDMHDEFAITRWDRRQSRFVPVCDRERGDLIAEFFKIDRAAFEAETAAVFEAVRQAAMEAAR